jgi:hypothetical protein
MSYQLTLRPEPGNWRAPADKRLALALKVLLRGYGLRCVTLREDSEASAVQGERGEVVSPGVNTADPSVRMRPGANGEAR